MKRILALLVLTAACDPQINITAPQSPQPAVQTPTPVTTPVLSISAPAPAKSCPVAVPLSPSTAVWTCTNDCTQVPFSIFYDSVSLPSSKETYGMVTASVLSPNVTSSGIVYLVNNDKNHNLIINGQLMLVNAQVSPSITTNYAASLDCDELTINGAIFTYTEQIN